LALLAACSIIKQHRRNNIKTQNNHTATIHTIIEVSVVHIGRVSYLIYLSMQNYVSTTSGDIVVCFLTAVCLSC